MTTKNSPLKVIRRQAEHVAATIKAAERGDPINVRFSEKIAHARQHKEAVKIGIVMDDKLLTIEIPWTTIAESSESALAEFIVKQMREETVH